MSIAMVMAGHFTKTHILPAGFGVTVFFVISVFVSWLSYRYVEQPMIRLGKQKMDCRRTVKVGF